MSRDPLAVLARLRGAEVMQARRALAEAAAARDAAEAGAEAAERALAEEARHGGPAYAAWIPHGLAARAAAEAAARRAAGLAGEAALARGGARAAERAVERLAEMRAEAARRDGLRAEQRVLDEAGARRAGPG